MCFSKLFFLNIFHAVQNSAWYFFQILTVMPNSMLYLITWRRWTWNKFLLSPMWSHKQLTTINKCESNLVKDKMMSIQKKMLKLLSRKYFKMANISLQQAVFMHQSTDDPRKILKAYIHRKCTLQSNIFLVLTIF